jgi:hypothetical protein
MFAYSQQCLEAAVVLMEQFRAPPSNSWERRSRWQYAGGTRERQQFEDGHGAKALLLLREGGVFTVRHRDRLDVGDADFVLVLHMGSVEDAVYNLNLRGHIEVYAARHLREPLFPMHRVRRQHRDAVQAVLGVDVGGLPQVHGNSIEVIFTGAKEGDLVEVSQPSGPSWLLVTPVDTEALRHRRLLQNARDF